MAGIGPLGSRSTPPHPPVWGNADSEEARREDRPFCSSLYTHLQSSEQSGFTHWFVQSEDSGACGQHGVHEAISTAWTQRSSLFFIFSVDDQINLVLMLSYTLMM